MTVRRLGIVLYGVTGRMGLNQRLARSIVAIREQGGVALPNGDRVMPYPILVGQIAEKWQHWRGSTKSNIRQPISCRVDNTAS
jgi:hypothetical protein